MNLINKWGRGGGAVILMTVLGWLRASKVQRGAAVDHYCRLPGSSSSRPKQCDLCRFPRCPPGRVA